MPSSHTACVVGLATAVGLQEGTSSTAFAVAMIFAVVVAFDATGVRLHAGKHASVLNVLVAHLPPEHPAADAVVFNETLGHTPAEVAAGVVVGLVTSLLLVGLWHLVAGG
jgi:acid phosphatase family membrane protein YuiD